MKKILCLSLFACALVSCSKSPVEKASVLIKGDILKSLVLPDSYDPVETKLDSAFSPFDSPDFFDLAYDIYKLDEEINEYDEKAKTSKSLMLIYERPYDAHSRNQYEEYKAEYEKYLELKASAEEKGQKLVERMQEQAQTAAEKGFEFIGYKVEHRYRAKNNAGNVRMGSQYYLLDKNLEKIINSYDVDGEKYQIHEAFLKMMQNQMED